MALNIISLNIVKHRWTIIITLVLLVLILLFSFGPTYIARYLITNTLNDFGIEHEGIKTIKINPWKREVWAGPVRFRTGDSDYGQLGEMGIKVRVFPVFEKHAMIERLLIRGIDIFVARTEDNILTLNGIPLDQFRPAAEAAEATQPEKETEPWGAGLAEFEMQDSRIIFKEKTGGTLTVEIESLQLGDFTSWLPDEPGSFQLKASVNDINLDLNGTARPFARHITLSLDADTREVELPKVIEFTGPLFGLERQAGVHNSTLHHEITLFDTGRIEGHSNGKIKVMGADYAKTDQYALAVEEANIDLDLRYSLSKTDSLQVDGQLAMELVNAGGSWPGENTIAIGTARLELAELSSVHGADSALHIETKPKIKIQQGTYSGRIQLSIDTFMNALRYLQSISTARDITAAQTGLGKWSGDEVTLPRSDISVAQLESTVSKLEFNSKSGNVMLDLASDSEVARLQISTSDRHTKVDTAGIKFETLQLRSGEGKTALKLNGENSITGIGIKGPIGNGTIKSVGLKQNIDLQIDLGDIVLVGTADAAVDQTHLRVHKTETLPQAKLSVAVLNTKVKKATFSLTGQKIKWQVNAGTTIERASAEYAKGKLSAAKFRRLEWRGASADQDLNLTTDRLIISGLDAMLTRQFVDGVLNDKQGEPTSKDNKTIKKETAATQVGTAKTVQPKIKIGRFELARGTRLRFFDKQVQPPFLFDLDIQRAEVRDIDSDNDKTKARARLLAKINEFTHFELNATARNEGPEMDLDLTSKLENLELPPYSSYAAEFGGVNLESGQFNSEVKVTARKGELDGAITLNINDLEFTPLSEADAQRLSETTGFPIETAASLLKDKEGNIDLALPVSGTVLEPDVDISSAINKAIGNTLKVVFPPTLIGSMLASAKKGQEMTFKPILFKPGSSNVDAVASEYLDELASLLKQRPTLSLNFCGRITPDDFQEVTLISIKLPANARPEAVESRDRLIKTHAPKLLELAIERTRIVRRYLIETRKLNARQVGECRSSFDPDDTDPPRVVVTL